MLSFDTRTRLANLFLAISDGERQIEIVRQILCEQIDFEPYAAFKRIDRFKKGALIAHDILKFLADNKISQTSENCKAFIKRYDVDGDGQLTYNEFLFAVLPMDNPTLRTIATQRPNYDVAEDQYLSYDVEYSLSKVIDREIMFYINLDFQKASLLKCHDFNYLDAFSAISRSPGKIDYSNLEDFFRQLGIYPNEDELVALLRRFDRNDDGCINYDEFVLGLEPLDALVRPSSYNSPLTFSKTYISPSKSRVYSPSRNLASISHKLEESSSLRKPADPFRRTASPFGTRTFQRATSPIRSTISPRKRVASPLRKIASPSETLSVASRRVSSPVRRVASPLRRVASPSRIASPGRRVASPLRTYGRSSVDARRVASPTRNTASVKFGQTSVLQECYKASFIEQERAASPVKFANKDPQFGFRSTASTIGASERIASPLRTQKIASSSAGFGSHTSPLRKSQLGETQSKSPLRQGLECRDANNTRLLKSTGKSILKKSGLYSMSASISEGSKGLSEKKTIKGSAVSQNDETKEVLIGVLKQFIQLEKELELIKQDLSLRPDFNLLDFFRTFDIEARGTISSNEFNEGLKKFGVYPTKEQLYLFLRRFDKDNDGKLRFSDFTEVFTCKQQEYATLLNNRTPVNADLRLDINQVFSEETKKTITKALRMQLENEASTETLKQKLARQYKYNVHEAFTYLDVKEDGVITIEEIGEVFDKNDFYATQKELKYLMERLDTNKDGKITYTEFVQEMTPKN